MVDLRNIQTRPRKVVTALTAMNIEEIVYHYFLYNGSVVDIVINYLLIILYTVTNLIPWTTCSSRRNIFINLHSLVVMTIQVLCWIFLEAYGVSLIWCGQLGLLLTWLLCLVRIFHDFNFLKKIICF